MKTRVALRLHSLRCIEETEHGSEPYLWPVMITHETGAPRMQVPTSDWAAKVRGWQSADKARREA